jgi:hypothetical protein
LCGFKDLQLFFFSFSPFPLVLDTQDIYLYNFSEIGPHCLSRRKAPTSGLWDWEKIYGEVSAWKHNGNKQGLAASHERLTARLKAGSGEPLDGNAVRSGSGAEPTNI